MDSITNSLEGITGFLPQRRLFLVQMIARQRYCSVEADRFLGVPDGHSDCGHKEESESSSDVGRSKG